MSPFSLYGTDQTLDSFFKTGLILQSEKRQEFLQTVHDLASSLKKCQIKNSVMLVPNGSKNPIWLVNKQFNQFQCTGRLRVPVCVWKTDMTFCSQIFHKVVKPEISMLSVWSIFLIFNMSDSRQNSSKKRWLVFFSLFWLAIFSGTTLWAAISSRLKNLVYKNDCLQFSFNRIQSNFQ